jgi:hypothetical protein
MDAVEYVRNLHVLCVIRAYTYMPELVRTYTKRNTYACMHRHVHIYDVGIRAKIRTGLYVYIYVYTVFCVGSISRVSSRSCLQFLRSACRRWRLWREQAPPPFLAAPLPLSEFLQTAKVDGEVARRRRTDPRGGGEKEEEETTSRTCFLRPSLFRLDPSFLRSFFFLFSAFSQLQKPWDESSKLLGFTMLRTFPTSEGYRCRRFGCDQCFQMRIRSVCNDSCLSLRQIQEL